MNEKTLHIRLKQGEIVLLYKTFKTVCYSINSGSENLMINIQYVEVDGTFMERTIFALPIDTIETVSNTEINNIAHVSIRLEDVDKKDIKLEEEIGYEKTKT